MNSNIFSNKNLIKYLFWYRIAVSLIAFFIIAEMTRLGDVGKFLDGDPLKLISLHGFKILTGKTYLPLFITGAVNRILHSDVLTNIFFCSLAYYGIRVFLESIPEKKGVNYKILVLLCFSPSFTIWSSVTGKEAIIVFAMGIICREIIRFFNGEKFRLSFLLIISLYLIIVLKPQYVPAVLQLIIYVKLREKINIRMNPEIVLMIIVILINIFLIYYFRHEIDDYAVEFQSRFNPESRSSRDIVFIEQFDFFKKMLYLMPLAMWGPTFSETKITALHLFSFYESMVLLCIFSYFLKDIIYFRIRNLNRYYQWLFLFIITGWWLFFAQYLQGIINPGSAVRYRTNLYLFLITMVYSITFINIKKDNA